MSERRPTAISQALTRALVETPIDGAVPDRDDLFRDVSVDDPIERLVRVESALHDMISANEPSLRLMLSFAAAQPERRPR